MTMTPRGAVQFSKLERPGGERLLVGVVQRPDVYDAHNDLAPADVLRYAAHDFVADYNTDTALGGLQHVPDAVPDADLVESFVADMDGETYGCAFLKGDWVIAVRVNSDALWEQCQDGTFNAFSPEGDILVQYLDEPAQFSKAESGEASNERPRKRILSQRVRAVSIVDHGANRIDFSTMEKSLQILKRKTMNTEQQQNEQPNEAKQDAAPAPPTTEAASMSKSEESETKQDEAAKPNDPVVTPPAQEQMSKNEEAPPKPAEEKVPEVAPPVQESMSKERRMTKGRRETISAAVTALTTAGAALQAMLDEVAEDSSDSSEGIEISMSKALEDKASAESRATAAEQRVSVLEASYSKSETDLAASKQSLTALEAKVAGQAEEIAKLSKALEEFRTARPAPATQQGRTIETIKKSEDGGGTFDGLLGLSF